MTGSRGLVMAELNEMKTWEGGMLEKQKACKGAHSLLVHYHMGACDLQALLEIVVGIHLSMMEGWFALVTPPFTIRPCLLFSSILLSVYPPVAVEAEGLWLGHT